MKQLAATALLAIVALFATSAGQASAGHRQSLLHSEGTWVFAGLSPAARANVAADAAATIPSARPVLDLLDGSIAVDTHALLCGPTGGCSRPEASQGRGWTMHLPANWVSGTDPAQRFLVLHEIGHAAWHLVLRGVDRSAFIAAVQQSLERPAVPAVPARRPVCPDRRDVRRRVRPLGRRFRGQHQLLRDAVPADVGAVRGRDGRRDGALVGSTQAVRRASGDAAPPRE